MKWSTTRRLLYILVFLLIVGGVIAYPAYKALNAPATCFDNKQNGDEDGVDCGGSCTKLCKNLELQPVVLWQRAFEVTPGNYSAIAYIQNPNFTAEANNVNYTFTIRDSDNTIVATRQGSGYIPPGRNFAIFEANIKVDHAINPKADFEFADDTLTWTVAAKKTQLTVSNAVYSAGSNMPTAEADLNNSSLKPVGRTVAVAILYGADGNAIAASQTVVDSVPAQSSKHVVYTWPHSFAVQPTKVEIVPITR